MERLKAHGIEPGAPEQVIVTRDGEAKWGPVPIPDMGIDDLNDVDTSTHPPAAGNALLWEGDQWVPGAVQPAEVPDVVPHVAASRTVRLADGPYSVPLPLEIVLDPEDPGVFVGLFVLVAHWENAPASVIDDLLALDPDGFELLAYTGSARTGSGPVMALLGCDPRADITLAAGSGTCELSLLAVADAVSFRGLPLPAPLLTINACDSLAGWSNPSGDPVTLGPGYIAAPVNNDGGLYGKHVTLDLVQSIDMTSRPILTVEWKVEGDDQLAVLAAQQTVVRLTADQPTTVVDMAVIRHEELEDDWRRTVFDIYSPNPITKIRLRAGVFEAPAPGDRVLFRDLTGIASPKAGINQFGAATQVPVEGIPAQENDLLILAVGTSDAARDLSVNGEVVAPVADSTPGNPTLTTTTYEQPVTFGGTLNGRGLSGTPGTGLAIVGVAVNGVGSFGPGNGGNLPAGGDEGDVLTLVDGEPVWSPAPKALPAGGAPGEVLTIVGGVARWEPPAAPVGKTYLVPLTAVVGGEPTLVWTADNQLVFVEETPT